MPPYTTCQHGDSTVASRSRSAAESDTVDFSSSRRLESCRGETRVTIKPFHVSAVALASFVLCGSIGWLGEAPLHAEDPARAWSPNKAAAYLDGRAVWWSTWSGAARDHGTFCISCHTTLPYALARPRLRDALHESGPSPAEALSLIHISEPTRLLSISYAVFCLKKKK